MPSRFALFSDIHGNLAALDAVLADMESRGIQGMDRYCLGDLVGYGPRPTSIIERIRSLGIPTVRGNYDEGIGNRRGECGCYYANEQARRDGQASYAFTEAAIGAEDARWLASLPEQLRFDVGDSRVLLTHGSPRKINEYLMPDRTDEQLVRLASEAGADLICVGHVHIPYHRAMVTDQGRRVHYISDGSVGKPKDRDPRACWTEVVIGAPDAVDAAAPNDPAAECMGAGPFWVGAIEHRVEYDVDAVVREMLQAGLPPTLAEALRQA